MGPIYRTASQVLIWLGNAASNSALAIALVRKLSKVLPGNLGEDGSRALLFRKPPQGLPACLKDWLDELFDDDSDLYKSASSDSDEGNGKGLSAGVAAIPGAVGNVVENVVENVVAVAATSFVSVFPLDDPKSEPPRSECGVGSGSDSDLSSVWGTNRLADVYLPLHGHRVWRAMQALISHLWFSRIWVI